MWNTCREEAGRQTRPCRWMGHGSSGRGFRFAQEVFPKRYAERTCDGTMFDIDPADRREWYGLPTRSLVRKCLCNLYSSSEPNSNRLFWSLEGSRSHFLGPACRSGRRCRHHRRNPPLIERCRIHPRPLPLSRLLLLRLHFGKLGVGPTSVLVEGVHRRQSRGRRGLIQTVHRCWWYNVGAAGWVDLCCFGDEGRPENRARRRDARDVLRAG